MKALLKFNLIIIVVFGFLANNLTAKSLTKEERAKLKKEKVRYTKEFKETQKKLIKILKSKNRDVSQLRRIKNTYLMFANKDNIQYILKTKKEWFVEIAAKIKAFAKYNSDLNFYRNKLKNGKDLSESTKQKYKSSVGENEQYCKTYIKDIISLIKSRKKKYSCSK